MHSRESTRARVRVGIIFCLALTLLVVTIGQGVLSAYGFDVAALAKSVGVILAVIATTYCLALAAMIAIVHRRRGAESEPRRLA